jgi:hypothetical protein
LNKFRNKFKISCSGLVEHTTSLYVRIPPLLVALKVARWGLSWEAACDNVAQVTLFFFFLSFLLSLFSFIFTLSKACYFVFKISEQPNTSKQNTNSKKFQNFHSLSLSFPEPKISEQPNTSKQNTNCNSLQSLLFCFWLENCDPEPKI